MSQRTVAGTDHEYLLAVTTKDGRTLSELPVLVKVTSVGERGTIATGHDKTGILQATFTFDFIDRRLNNHFEIKMTPYFPFEMKPLARFLAHFRSPGRFALRTVDGSDIATGPIPDHEAMAAEEFPAILDDLVLVQWAAGMTRKVGPQLLASEMEWVAIAARLIRGDSVAVTWADTRVGLKSTAPEDVRRRMAAELIDFRLRTPAPHVVEIDGTRYSVGVATEVEVPSARLADQHSDWVARAGG
jgi:hypothetical protein